jgi:hypothetical protein
VLICAGVFIENENGIGEGKVFDEHTRTDQHNALLLVNMYCIKNLSISKNYSMLFKNFIDNKE